MWAKLRTLLTIDTTGTILIVRLDDAAMAEGVAEAAIEGGVRAVEITLSTPGALGVIERLAARHGGSGVAIGAGTVLDELSAYRSIEAGAAFVVSPQLNPAMVRTASRYQVVTASGASTPTEILATVEAGADIVKYFPADAGSIATVKAVLAPLSQVPLMPAGGVSAANVGDWFAAGVACVGVGSFITKAWQTDGDLSHVTRAAAQFMAAVAAVR